MRFALGLFLSGLVANCRGFAVLNTKTANSFIPTQYSSLQLEQKNDYRKSHLQMSFVNEEEDDDEEEEEVGKMRVSEITAELKLRGVDFSDCFDKDSLSKRLLDARCKGKADPTIIDQFNQQSKNDIDENKVEFDDEILNKAAGGDGTLPGGMPPDMMKQLMSNPELVALLQDPKMQDVMKVMMTGGQDAMEDKMKNDPEVYELVMKLNRIMARAM